MRKELGLVVPAQTTKCNLHCLERYRQCDRRYAGVAGERNEKSRSTLSYVLVYMRDPSQPFHLWISEQTQERTRRGEQIICQHRDG